MEQHLVVFPHGKVAIAFNLNADLDHATGDRGDFGLVGQHNSPSRPLSRFVLAN
jgi:hypothetical protein